MSDTLSHAEATAIGQTIDRTLRYLKHSKLLAAAKRSGDVAAQLQHSLHVADSRLGLAKSPSERTHWAAMHSETRALIDEAGFTWAKGRLVDPAAQPAPEPATQPARRTFAKSFGPRAAEFQALRGEIMLGIARARASGDAQSRMELCELRANLERQAAGAGLRLDHDMRFVPVG